MSNIKCQKSKVREKGFTLIELLLYIAITSIILMVMSTYLIVVLQARVKNQTIAEVDQQAIQVMQRVSQSLRNAVTLNSPSQGATSPSLSLDTVVVSKNPTVFDTVSGVIRITEGIGSPAPLTSSRVIVSGLTFSNLSRLNTPGTIRIQFTLSHINPEGRNEYDYSKTYYASASLR